MRRGAAAVSPPSAAAGVEAEESSRTLSRGAPGGPPDAEKAELSMSAWVRGEACAFTATGLVAASVQSALFLVISVCGRLLSANLAPLLRMYDEQLADALAERIMLHSGPVARTLFTALALGLGAALGAAVGLPYIRRRVFPSSPTPPVAILVMATSFGLHAAHDAGLVELLVEDNAVLSVGNLRLLLVASAAATAAHFFWTLLPTLSSPRSPAPVDGQPPPAAGPSCFRRVARICCCCCLLGLVFAVAAVAAGLSIAAAGDWSDQDGGKTGAWSSWVQGFKDSAHYDTLGVPRGAPWAEVQAAFKRERMRWCVARPPSRARASGRRSTAAPPGRGRHPDKCAVEEKSMCEERFIRAQNAFEALKATVGSRESRRRAADEEASAAAGSGHSWRAKEEHRKRNRARKKYKQQREREQKRRREKRDTW